MDNIQKQIKYFFSDNSEEIIIKPSSIEYAYILILNNDLKNAKKIFKMNSSPRALWGIFLVSTLEGYLEEMPTFFQIRNFIEIDLDFLIKNEKIDYVEKFLGVVEFLIAINQETYKFIARVMLGNNIDKFGVKYLEKSKEVFYNDPELHFIYADFYIKEHQYKKALDSINECLYLLPDYYPAKQLKIKLEQLV